MVSDKFIVTQRKPAVGKSSVVSIRAVLRIGADVHRLCFGTAGDQYGLNLQHFFDKDVPPCVTRLFVWVFNFRGKAVRSHVQNHTHPNTVAQASAVRFDPIQTKNAVPDERSPIGHGTSSKKKLREISRTWQKNPNHCMVDQSCPRNCFSISQAPRKTRYTSMVRCRSFT